MLTCASKSTRIRSRAATTYRTSTPPLDSFADSVSRFTKGELILHASACVEVLLSAFLTILFTDPIWQLRINSCGVQKVSDWYTLFHNPTPNYETTLYCTQEAVYPLQTMIFVFYLFCVTFMMIIRPGLNVKFLPYRGKLAVYYALYIFPILALLHAVAGGVICEYRCLAYTTVRDINESSGLFLQTTPSPT